MRYFVVRITNGWSLGPFNIYFDQMDYDTNNYLATLRSGGLAENLSYDEMLNGVEIAISDNTEHIILYDIGNNSICPYEPNIKFVPYNLETEIVNISGLTQPSTIVNCNLFIPSQFSPDNNGINDEFIIDCLENYPYNQIWIYNGDGIQVYKTKSYHKSWWNGKVDNTSVDYVPAGYYSYTLKIYSNNLYGTETQKYDGIVMVSY